MKTFARIATAFVAAIASFFVAAPAFAAGGGVEKYNPADEFSAVGQPVDFVAILVFGAIVLAIVLILAQVIGNLFEKKA